MIHREYKGVDVFRIIACVLVIIIHTKPLIMCGDAINYYIDCICRIAVPFFFIVGGFFFFLHGGNIKKYVTRMFTLYSAWFLFESPVWLSILFNKNHSFTHNVVHFFHNLVFTDTFVYSWYVMAAIQGTLIVYFLSKYISSELIILFSLPIYVTACFCGSYYGLFSKPIQEFLDYLIIFFPPTNTFWSSVIFISIGKWFCEGHFFNTRKSCVFLFISLVFYVFEIVVLKDYQRRTDCFLSLIPVAMLVFSCLVNVNLCIDDSTCVIIRKMTLCIYLLHGYVLWGVRTVIPHYKGFFCFVIITITSVFFSVILLKLSAKHNRLKYLL